MHSKQYSLTEGSIWKAMLFFAMPVTVLQMVVVWAFLYFATGATIAVWLVNKPFALLAQR